MLTWSAQYYQFPIGEVVHSALPTLLRQGKPYNLLARTWKLLDPDAEAKVRRSDKQQEAYRILKLHPVGTTENVLNMAGIETATLKALEKKRFAPVCWSHKISIRSRCSWHKCRLLPILNKTCSRTGIKISQSISSFLLDGLTGSGKTEVYLQIMEQVLKQGKQVLVLVPEIGLTPQTISRFQSRFHCHIALLHSGLNDSKRLQAWQSAETGKASIVLGTRSAIYTPMPNLGLIILDEEHDLSFKQQEGFRYHARDVALYRGHLQQCPVILGSATPSIDSYALVQHGKMQALELNQRAGTALMPKIHILDLKVAQKAWD